METSRRNFIKTSAVAAAGISLLQSQISSAFAAKNKTILAVQLYCVREDMKTDPLGSLTKLAKMGYTHVEHANYVNHKFYGWTPAEYKKVLDDLGLKMPSGHTVLGINHWDATAKDFTSDWKKLVDNAAFMGQEYVISPWLDAKMRSDYDTFLKWMEVFNKCGELCKKSGMKFGYHNHDFEFSTRLNGEKIWDLIMKNTDADKVVMQLDTGNMYLAGAIARDVLAQYPGRYENIHIKDMVKSEGSEKYESGILGKGVVNIKQVLELAKASGTKLYVIEQESYQGKTPMDCMKEDLAVMKSWGF
jgi:sugar phosphate isomerase/epimerase